MVGRFLGDNMSAETNNPIYRHGYVYSVPELLSQVQKLTKSQEEISIGAFNEQFEPNQDEITFLNEGGYERDRNSSQNITLENCKCKRVYTGYMTPEQQKIYLFFKKSKEWNPNIPDSLFKNWSFVSCNTERGFQEQKAVEFRENNVKLNANDDFYEELAHHAVDETWDYRHNVSQNNKPLLRNYIRYTLRRLAEENKILESKDGSKIIFNTGLFSPLFEPILIMADKIERNFYKNPEIVEGSRRSLMAIPFLKRSLPSGEGPAPEDYVAELDDVPFASFFKDTGELVFDPNLKIDMSGDDFHNHIFLDKDRRKRFRLPDASITDTGLFDKLTKAKERAQKIAKRNYKLVVPQWSFEYGRVQFLMPMYWEQFKGEPFCALVLDLVTDYKGKYYEAKTILTLDDCYQNARLIAKPDNTWLIPEGIEQDAEES